MNYKYNYNHIGNNVNDNNYNISDDYQGIISAMRILVKVITTDPVPSLPFQPESSDTKLDPDPLQMAAVCERGEIPTACGERYLLVAGSTLRRTNTKRRPSAKSTTGSTAVSTLVMETPTSMQFLHASPSTVCGREAATSPGIPL